jgi:uncharacterized phage infection (PIP) family protein YhgE
MISLEQIRLLEQKVQAAVARIGQLKQENATLKEHLSSYQKRIDELEVLVDSFKADQGQIEQGILNALAQLDQLEDEVTSPAATPQPAQATERMPEPTAPADEAPAPAGANDTQAAEALSEQTPEDDTPQDVPEEDDEEDAGPELDIF